MNDDGKTRSASDLYPTSGAERSGRAFFRLALPCLCLLAPRLASAAPPPPPALRPNVLLLVSDDQRPDTIAALGNPVIQTPCLDRLAREGVAMMRAVAPNPICTPSRAEILSGCSGFRNGVFDFGGRIDPQLTLWPQTMRRAGYRTAYVGKWHNDGRPGDHGYDETPGLFAGGGGRWAVDQTDWKGKPVTGYRGWVFQTNDRQFFPERGVGLTADTTRQIADAAIYFLRRTPKDRPFFLHVNFTAPHDPLIMPPGMAGKYRPDEMPLPKNFLPEHPFDHGNFLGRDERLLPWPRTPEIVRRLLAIYYAVISDLDYHVGRILEELDERGVADRTIVIFTSDHGVAAGSHGLRGKQNMYEHTIGTPLILRGPGVPRGRRRRAQVYLRDLYPTACELAGIPVPPSVQGRSFVAVLDGRAESIRPDVFCYFRDKQRMIRTDRWKLIYYPQINRYQLFDLAEDPFETKDRSADAKWAGVLAELRNRLEARQRRAGDPLLEKKGVTGQ